MDPYRKVDPERMAGTDLAPQDLPGIVMEHEREELEDLVRRCGKVFGLELYGVDLVKTPKGFSVIEVNCFPGFKGVPEAGSRISKFILERAG